MNIRGTRYIRRPHHNALAKIVQDTLPYLGYSETLDFYTRMTPHMDEDAQALLACNDRFFLLTALLNRRDALHPWLFERCREVEASPDHHLDLWAREHYKSTIITFAGVIQEILADPELTVGIFSHTKEIARKFVAQIKRELESNKHLQTVFSDVLYADLKEAPRWSINEGIIVKRRSNPKESTVEGWGLVDGMPTGKHFGLLVYDDVVTRESVSTPDQIKKTTEAWELSDNLSRGEAVRKWVIGTRYSFADTYGVLLERNTLKARVYPATDDGTLNGKPVLYSEEWWTKKKQAQRSSVAAQMLLNPIAGQEAIFRAEWFRPYDIRPSILNVYIMVDPSKGRTQRSDRTAIAVVGIDTNGNKYLLDGYRHRMSLSERWQAIKTLYQHWSRVPGVQSVRVGYERYGAQSDDEYIQEAMIREDVVFDLEELAWPREGGHSKEDRVQRLEPDFRMGRFFLPLPVYHPDLGNKERIAEWRFDQTSENIRYAPMQSYTKNQRAMIALGQSWRVPKAIRRIDEDRNVYDVTRALIEEMMFFPFSPKDDLVDAVSRIYDMDPTPPALYSANEVEVRDFVDA